jgi:S1-C subfamily serine protease
LEDQEHMKVQGFWARPAAVVMVAALGLGGIALVGADRLGIVNPPASLRFANPDEPPSRNSFAPVVKRVVPAVVSITSSKMVKTGLEGEG